jgi:DnaD/phage-associated family protein
MSIRLMQLALEDLRLSAAETLLLVVMADFANDDGHGIFPSGNTIAKRARLSKRQVQRLVRDLQDRGYLHYQGQAPAGTNMWKMNEQMFSVGGDMVSPPHDMVSPPPCHGVTQDSNSNTNTNKLDSTTTTSDDMVSPPPDMVPPYHDMVPPHDIALCVGAWESIGMLVTPFAAECFDDWMKEVPVDWVVDAIHEAARNNKRTLSYVGGIIRNWRAKGQKSTGEKAKQIKNDFKVIAVDGDMEVEW